MQCVITIVDAEPVWRKQGRRVIQIDVPDFAYRILEETSGLTGSSPESLLHGWIQEHARDQAAGSDGKAYRRCRLLASWLSLGFTGRESDVRHFAQRLLRE